MKMIRTLLIIIGWLAACYALLNVVGGVNIGWNLFNWSPPKWDAGVVIAGVIVLAILGCIWFLARMTRDRVSQVMSFIVCLSLAGIAFTLLPAEHLTCRAFLCRTMPSPLWYRGGIFVILCSPCVMWLWSIWQQYHSDHDNVA
jgi:hypothetical protein